MKDEDWYKLEKAGWNVKWEKDNKRSWQSEPSERWLGALATVATKEFAHPRDAMIEFELLTGQKVTDEGCNCCGPPHTFSWEKQGDDDYDNYAGGSDCFQYLHGTNIDHRAAIEMLKSKGLL